ncbi:hypothetical protein D0Z07_3320 [Hyphodiscus hymeniophilus]|uniref:Uncharacterized protein n=1 Tax=Hyphodiscus hymeniophilus TaxID=353542 RepID=A0A9P6VMH0_9HELO|nr:hypothetical protein D0Z07_3320 [Hyphodiscus hymeniophilus]
MTWTSQAANLKAAIHTSVFNWDPVVGAFKDSDTDDSVHPEDGNSLALAICKTAHLVTEQILGMEATTRTLLMLMAGVPVPHTR